MVLLSFIYIYTFFIFLSLYIVNVVSKHAYIILVEKKKNVCVKDCIINSFQCIDVDKIPDLKKEGICFIQFYSNIRKMFPVQIFISFNVQILNRICRIKLFSNEFNLHFTVYLLSLVFKNYQFNFLHI